MAILVVDDYPDAAESTAALLRLYGYQVSTALNGLAALSEARRHRPDVVLLDLSMPEMDGFEVARRLLDMFGDGILLVALTAQGFDEDRERCREAGFTRLLVKPMEPQELHNQLRELTTSR